MGRYSNKCVTPFCPEVTAVHRCRVLATILLLLLLPIVFHRWPWEPLQYYTCDYYCSYTAVGKINYYYCKLFAICHIIYFIRYRDAMGSRQILCRLSVRAPLYRVLIGYSNHNNMSWYRLSFTITTIYEKSKKIGPNPILS